MHQNPINRLKFVLAELKENTKLMQIWMKTNPKKAEDFLQFKNGYEAKEAK